MTKYKKSIFLIFFFVSICLYAQDSVLQPEYQLGKLINTDNWIIGWSANILQSQQRETIKKYVHNIENHTWYDDAFDIYHYWYENKTFQIERIIQTQTENKSECIKIGIAHEIIISECMPIKSGFRIIGHESIYNKQNDIGSYINWQELHKHEVLSLSFIFDGDYLDIYIDDEKKQKPFLVFCKFNDATMKEFENLIYTNTPPDNSRVNWPRRADGSMDYPPPTKASITKLPSSDLSIYGYMTTSNLRLRASADTKASVIITLKQGEHVQVLQKGVSVTIDGITAAWVQVKTPTGETGWCFGGYLSPAP